LKKLQASEEQFALVQFIEEMFVPNMQQLAAAALLLLSSSSSRSVVVAAAASK
jgi:hypothetical protein